MTPNFHVRLGEIIDTIRGSLPKSSAAMTHEPDSDELKSRVRQSTNQSVSRIRTFVTARSMCR